MESIIGIFLTIFFIVFCVVQVVRFSKTKTIGASIIDWSLFGTSVWYLLTHYLIK